MTAECSGCAALRERLSALEERAAAQDRVLLAGGASRRLSLEQAFAEGVLLHRPSTVRGWQRKPETRRRMRLELLIHREAGKLFVTPGSVAIWTRALEHEQVQRVTRMATRRRSANRAL